ncbi:hypothetical protein FHS82_001019 [Pseudochelatococcus lubricantis]|uniref:GcrA cell cycle regulator n=1 Tax=Pseudochelatococcus lubricantis TaxID=1538102 RepID=A0ABX0UXR9_9HYPH|nr:hypothetical protein [Pseudochelatococcus lubricantis]NIJ57193.1 hypothetical protein [Pseudochelatococcus lubricantis]
MATKRPLDWSAEVLEAIAAARYAGITVREVAAALGICIGRVEIKLSEAGIRTGARNQASTRSPDADIHIAVLARIAANNTQTAARSARQKAVPPPKPVAPVARPCATAPSLAAELGIRVHTNRNGVSLPYLSSLYGGARHG